MIASAVAETVSVPVSGEMTHADFVFEKRGGFDPRVVVVLCPGQNEAGAEYLRDKSWKDFAEEENAVIAVPHFESADDLLDRKCGYFEASRGSGRLLEEALKKAGYDQLPMLFYSFSGGAHFAMSFARWKPDRVVGFCAYSFGWWSEAPEGLKSPALIVCGEKDGRRYASVLEYFQAGRRQGKPWTWVSLRDKGHEASPELEAFARKYFSSLLSSKKCQAVEVDNVTGKVVKDKPCQTTSILPCEHLLSSWRRLHRP